MTGCYPIKGIPIQPWQDENNPPIRREINHWHSDTSSAIQVSLFIRAFRRFYKMDSRDKLSYYRVAGEYQRMPSGHGVEWLTVISHSWIPSGVVMG